MKFRIKERQWTLRLAVLDQGNHVDISSAYFQHQIKGILENNSNKAIEVKALVFQSPGVASPPRKKVSATLSSPVSKKKLPFMQDFTASRTTQDFELDKPEEEKKCNTPFERYMKKGESDIERKKSELCQLEMEKRKSSSKYSKCNLVRQMATCVETETFDLGIQPEIAHMESACPYLIVVRRNYIQENSTTGVSNLPLIN